MKKEAEQASGLSPVSYSEYNTKQTDYGGDRCGRKQASHTAIPVPFTEAGIGPEVPGAELVVRIDVCIACPQAKRQHSLEFINSRRKGQRSGAGRQLWQTRAPWVGN